MPYIYAADIYCDSCGAAIKSKTKEPDYPQPWDSDDYPDYWADPGESDTPQHCGSHSKCLEAIDTEDGKVGALLDYGLTKDGAVYVYEALSEAVETARRPWAVLRAWANLLREQGYDRMSGVEGELQRWDGYVAGWKAAESWYVALKEYKEED